MRTIGIAGTAKNTGKTTTALEIIRQSEAAGLRHALTSIGFDGEEIDNITGLPKPRYLLPKGAYLATGKRCLSEGSAGYQVVVETAVRTVLGPVVVVEITEPGLVLVAGPNRTPDLLAMFDVFRGMGVDVVIVDGALNRMMPLLQTDGLVLCTGAKLDTRISRVAKHAQALHSLFVPRAVLDAAEWGQRITITFDRGAAVELGTGSLLGEETAREIGRQLTRPVRDLVIPGACDVRVMRGVLEQGAEFLASARLVFGSPLNLVASGDPLGWSCLLQEVQARGQVTGYLKEVPLLLLTVNPFYPRYLPGLKLFEPAAVDGDELLGAVKDGLPGFPVLDIKRMPRPDLLGLLGLRAA